MLTLNYANNDVNDFNKIKGQIKGAGQININGQSCVRTALKHMN